MGLYLLYICRIVRFIIENTIEERILQLQEKKELVFEGSVLFVFQLDYVLLDEVHFG